MPYAPAGQEEDRMINAHHRRYRGAGAIVSLVTVATVGLAGCGSASAHRSPAGVASKGAAASTPATAASGRAATSGKMNLLTPGVIHVATRTGSLPYINVQGNDCTGIDCNVLKAAAKNLGLRLQFDPMSFQASLAAVQTHRDDMAIGGITWNKARAATGLFTDTVEYEPLAVLQRPDSSIHTIAELQGKKAGTVTGFNVISGLQHISGVQVRTYNTADAVYADVSNGRLDIGFVGALQDKYVKSLRPNLHFVSVPLTVTPQEIQQTPAYAVFIPHQNCFYVSKAEPALEQALTKQIDELYASGEIAKLVTGFGITDSTPFVTAPDSVKTVRVGTDRPSGWVAPSIHYAAPTPTAS